MIVNSGINRFASGWAQPKLVGNGSIALANDVGAPSTSYQNAGYRSAVMGMGGVFDDISNGNFSNLPSSVINGLGSGDVGSYAVVGLLALFVLPLVLGGFGGGKSGARKLSRRASLKGAIARESELLKGA